MDNSSLSDSDETPGDQDDDAGVVETTDIDSDEGLDGDVDAEGASAIRHRNE
jgi:hypothetical protein